MKKFLILLFLVLAVVLAVPAFAGNVGTWVDVAITTSAVYSVVPGSVLAVIPQDDGNTAAARSISMIDVAGNTIFSKTFIAGEELPSFVFQTPLYSASNAFFSRDYAGIAVSGGGVSITSGFKAKVLIGK